MNRVWESEANMRAVQAARAAQEDAQPFRVVAGVAMSMNEKLSRWPEAMSTEDMVRLLNYQHNMLMAFALTVALRNG